MYIKRAEEERNKLSSMDEPNNSHRETYEEPSGEQFSEIRSTVRNLDAKVEKLEDKLYFKEILITSIIKY